MSVTSGCLVAIAYACLIALLYALAHRCLYRAPRCERFARITLIILNAGANGTLLAWLGAPTAAAAVVATINLGAAVPRIASSRLYATVLAWTSPVMPMSWSATGAGVVALAVDVIAAPFGRPIRLGFDARTLTVIVYGGVVYLFECGYNLGNFVFVHAHLLGDDGRCSPRLIAHETGHTLNVAAFGSVFHFVGAIHENYGPPRGGARETAYAELWAETRSRAPGRPWLDGWGEAKP